MALLDYLRDLGAWNWFIVAAVMGALETIIPGVHFMWFGIAAVIMGGLTLLVPIPLSGQLILFALMSLASIWLARRFWAPQDIKPDVADLNQRGSQYIGRMVTVVDPITNGRGKVQVGDTVWTAEGPDLPAGSRVKVTGVNGTVLVVKEG